MFLHQFLHLQPRTLAIFAPFDQYLLQEFWNCFCWIGVFDIESLCAFKVCVNYKPKASCNTCKLRLSSQAVMWLSNRFYLLSIFQGNGIHEFNLVSVHTNRIIKFIVAFSLNLGRNFKFAERRHTLLDLWTSPFNSCTGKFPILKMRPDSLMLLQLFVLTIGLFKY